MRMWVATVVLVLLLGATADAQPLPSETVWEFYWLEAGTGAVGSLAGFAVGALAGRLGACDDPFLCALAVSWLGGTGAVVTTGTLMGVSGNLYFAPLGAIVGGSTGFLLDVMLNLLLKPKQNWFVFTHALAGLSAALGYNIGARLEPAP